MNWEAETREIEELSGNLATTKRMLKEETESLETAKTTLAHSQQAQEVLQLVAQAVQQRAHEKISEVVSICLSTVFDDPYEFKIMFERKRGKTEAVLRFVRRGLEVDPLTAAGGGMLDVAAFALRISCLMLHRPKLSRVVVIDEGFKFVSAEYRPRVRQMLETLAQDLNLQIIQVTHISEFEVGNIIRL